MTTRVPGWMVILITACLAGMPASADTRANQMAYDYALRCFVAGGMLTGDRRNNAAAAEAASKGARKSFDTVYRLGSLLGYSDAQISADLDSSQRSEVRHMTADSGYYKETKARCIKLGLM